MKTKYLIQIIFIIVCITNYCVNINAQSSNQNYIKTRTFTNDDGSKYLDEIQYYDGLGLPNQNIRKNAGIDEIADIVSIQEYSIIGKDSVGWLPAGISNNNGLFISELTVKNKIEAYYGAGEKPYNKIIYEQSPVNKILSQFGPGKSWHSNQIAIKTEYLANNGTSGDLSCILFSITGTGEASTLQKNGYYLNNQLDVVKVTDEDGNISYKFVNSLDQTILVRQINYKSGNQKELLDTYYVYDIFGNLGYVLPPLASDALSNKTSISDNDNEMKQYAYLYKYDKRQRCSKKRIPGTGWVEYVFDEADRIIFSQDSVQRSQGLWYFSIPDVLGRIVLTGTCEVSITNKDAYLSGKVVKAIWANEANSNGGYTIENISLPYYKTNLTINYFDNYEFIGKNNVPASLAYEAKDTYGNQYKGENKGFENNGLLTGTKVGVLDNSQNMTTYLYSAIYYDDKGNIVQTKSQNQKLEVEKEFLAYNFTGLPINKLHIHKINGNETEEVYTYKYDHAGRLTETLHKMGTAASISLSKNKYDDLGRLTETVKGGNNNIKQTYQYNIRSWISSISGTKFIENLAYTYNGNVKSMEWILDGQTRKYIYSYDNLSRLIDAAYTGIGTENYSSSYTYDKHGNMQAIKRYGKVTDGNYKLVDNLDIKYNGNQVRHIADNINSADNPLITESADFKDKNNSTAVDEYVYNGNGAMVKDLNKNISEIKYNVLNLPKEISLSLGQKFKYTYSASGEKLKVEQDRALEPLSTPIVELSPYALVPNLTTTTEYVGNKIYNGTQLKRILVDGGYIENNVYYFYLTDHLGNNRVVSNASGTLTQKNHYYPFGTAFADGYDNGSSQPYKYTGKELDRMQGLNLYDYSARYYESAIGRFTTVDPHAERYYSWSPYHYAGNNPIRITDPTGMDWWTTNDPEKIMAFLNSHGSGASGHDFSGWDHHTERPEDVGMFGFDDSAGQFHMTAGDFTKSFNSSILPVLGESGAGYAGAYVYSYSGDGGLYNAGYNAAQFGEISAFAAEFMAPFDPNNYFDGVNNWNVDTSGRLTGVNNIQESKKGGGGKAAAKMLKGLVQQATNLSHKIGKNSVKMTTPNVRYHYDLRGPAHKGVNTPHVQRSLPNVDPSGTLHWNKDSKWVRPMTQQEIRMIRKRYGF